MIERIKQSSFSKTPASGKRGSKILLQDDLESGGVRGRVSSFTEQAKRSIMSKGASIRDFVTQNESSPSSASFQGGDGEGVGPNLSNSPHASTPSSKYNVVTRRANRSNKNGEVLDSLVNDDKYNPTTTAEQKDEVVRTLANLSLVLLFLVGIITGVLCGLVLWASKMLSIQIVEVMDFHWHGIRYGVGLFVICSVSLVTFSAYLCTLGTKGSNALFGSGMPEVKALLGTDFHSSELPKLVSLRIFCIRICTIVMCLSSGLSVGATGPLVHVTTCTAYMLMKYIPEFSEVFESPSHTKMIFAASAASGLSAVFNAPVGGLLFSVEVTSTFYLISNYWRSFMAATAGAIVYNLLILAREDVTSNRSFKVEIDENPYHNWEIPCFIIYGCIIGYVADGYTKLHQWWHSKMKRLNKLAPMTMSAVMMTITAIIIFTTGSYSRDGGLGISVTVKDLFIDNELSRLSQWKENGISEISGLAIVLASRVLVSLLCTNLKLPTGLFMPMFVMGAMSGRLFGLLVQYIVGVKLYLGGYAMVGAVSFVSGATHTLSAAVITIEMTGQLEMLLPCLIGAVLASGIARGRGTSMYDQGMRNKGLESFELLLKESKGFKDASSIMDKNVLFASRACTNGELFKMLVGTKQTIFPVVNTKTKCRLVGAVQRVDIYNYLKSECEKQHLSWYLRETLPDDTDEADLREARLKAKGGKNRWSMRKATKLLTDQFGGANSPGKRITERLRRPSSAPLHGRKVPSPNFPGTPQHKDLEMGIISPSKMKGQGSGYGNPSPFGGKLFGGSSRLSSNSRTPLSGAIYVASPDADEGIREEREDSPSPSPTPQSTNGIPSSLPNTPRIGANGYASMTTVSEIGAATSYDGANNYGAGLFATTTTTTTTLNDATSNVNTTNDRALAHPRQLEPILSSRTHLNASTTTDNAAALTATSNNITTTKGSANLSGKSPLPKVLKQEKRSAAMAVAMEEVEEVKGPAPLYVPRIKRPPCVESALAMRERAMASFTIEPAVTDVVNTTAEMLDNFDTAPPSTQSSADMSAKHQLEPMLTPAYKGLSITAPNKLPKDHSPYASYPPSNSGSRSNIDYSYSPPPSTSPTPAGQSSFPNSSSPTPVSPMRGGAGNSAASSAQNTPRRNEDTGNKSFNNDDQESVEQKNEETVDHHGFTTTWSPSGGQNDQVDSLVFKMCRILIDKSAKHKSVPLTVMSRPLTVEDLDTYMFNRWSPSGGTNPLVDDVVYKAARSLVRLVRKRNDTFVVEKRITASLTSIRRGSVFGKLAGAMASAVKHKTPIATGLKKGLTTDYKNNPQIKSLLKHFVDVVKEPLMPVNGFPFTASEKTPMEQIYVLFEMVKVDCIFIVEENKKLMGMISKDLLLERLKAKTK